MSDNELIEEEEELEEPLTFAQKFLRLFNKMGDLFILNIYFTASIIPIFTIGAAFTALYTVTTKKAINLQYHDVFKRLTDSKIFRVTSDGDDKHTPKSAGLNMRQVSAEEWILTDE